MKNIADCKRHNELRVNVSSAYTRRDDDHVDCSNIFVIILL